MLQSVYGVYFGMRCPENNINFISEVAVAIDRESYTVLSFPLDFNSIYPLKTSFSEGS